MTSTMTKILLALLALAMMTGAASAQQQRTIYDAGGNVVGRAAIFDYTDAITRATLPSLGPACSLPRAT